MRRASSLVGLVCVLALASGPLSGCMRTTQFPRAEIPRLRPLMAGEPPGTDSVVLHGTYDVRIRRDTELELVGWDGRRERRAIVTPSQLSYRTDGLWVGDKVLLARSIIGLEMTRFSCGRTFAFALAVAGGAVLTLFTGALIVNEFQDDDPPPTVR